MKLKAKTENTVNLDHVPILNNPGPIMTSKDLKPKQIYQKVKLNEENSLRNQLLVNKVAKRRNTIIINLL